MLRNLPSDYPDVLQVWTNPDAAPQARRLHPAAARSIEMAAALGFPKTKIAALYGLNRRTVERVIARAKRNPDRMKRDLWDVAALLNETLPPHMDQSVKDELFSLLSVLRLMRLDEERNNPKPRRKKKGKR